MTRLKEELVKAKEDVTNDHLEKEIGELKEEKKSLTQQVSQRIKLIDSLKEKLESQHENILKFEAVLEEKNNEQMRIYQRLQMTQETNTTLNAQLELESKRINELESQLKENTNNELVQRLIDVAKLKVC